MVSRAKPIVFEEVEASWVREYPDMPLQGFLVAAALMRMGRIVEKDFSELCVSRFGLIGAEMVLLFALRRLGPPYAARPAQLKRSLLLPSGTVTKQIDRLSRKGLVERRQDPHSRNGQLISLTDAGRTLADEAASMLTRESVAVSAFASLPEPLAAEGWKFCHAMADRLEGEKPT